MSKIDAERLFGIITLAGIGMCTITLIVLHLLPTGLSALRNPVSQYGISEYRVGYRIQTVTMGLAAIAAAVGIGIVDIQDDAVVVALLAVCGAARLAISWFPMDTPGGVRSETGRRHGVLAIVAFVCAAIACLRLGQLLNRAHIWAGLAPVFTGDGIVMILSLLSMGATRQNETIRAYFGLIERVFYFGAIVFIVLVGARLSIGH